MPDDEIENGTRSAPEGPAVEVNGASRQPGPGMDRDEGETPGPRVVGTGGLDSELRRRIVRRFEVWLDDVLADERPPEGLDAEILAGLESGQWPGLAADEESPDNLGALWSAMTALAQETKLQGRAFKQLHESLSSLEDLPESVRGVVSAHGEALAAVHNVARQAGDLQARQLRQAADTARQETETKLLNVLLDVRDRLVRGAGTARDQLAAARHRRPGPLRRLLGRDRGGEDAAAAAKALLDGCVLSLQRLDESLGTLGVEEIPCQGQPFDPRRMTAAAVTRTADLPDGTVAEVLRPGYQWHGRVHRLAEVSVARRADGRPAAGEPESNDHE